MLMNSKKFAMNIESIVKEKKIPYMDAVVKFCEDNDIDPATVGPLINKFLFIVLTPLKTNNNLLGL